MNRMSETAILGIAGIIGTLVGVWIGVRPSRRGDAKRPDGELRQPKRLAVPQREVGQTKARHVSWRYGRCLDSKRRPVLASLATRAGRAPPPVQLGPSPRRSTLSTSTETPEPNVAGAPAGGQCRGLKLDNGALGHWQTEDREDKPTITYHPGAPHERRSVITGATSGSAVPLRTARCRRSHRVGRP